MNTKAKPRFNPLENFDSLPDSAFVNQRVVEALFACAPATVWRRTQSGLLPEPKKFGRSTRWNVGSLRRALEAA